MLRRTVLFAVFIVCATGVSHAQVFDDFADGDFTTNPTWIGDDSEWLVTAGELQSNGAAITPNTIHLSTSSLVASDAQWEFYVNPKTATSSGNYAEVHLVSDSANLESDHNGYFVRIGDTQDDVSLWEKTGSTNTKIIDGINGMIASSTNNPTRVKVLRDAAFNWTLFADPSGTGASYQLIGTSTDNTHTASQFFGVLVRHSSTNFNKYFFDDLYAGPVVNDTDPPVVVSVTVVGSTQVDVLFNETVDQTTAETEANYTVDGGIGNPTSAVRDATNPSIVHLTFSTPFTDGQSYQLTVTNVSDENGNTLTSGTATFSYTVTGGTDVIINELMADPTPVVGLPDAEFIELHNRSAVAADITGWKLTDGTSTATIGSHVIPAGGYVIVTSTANAPLFTAFGPAIGVGSFPSLNNSGDIIQLLDPSNNVVDEVSFTLASYNDALKQNGGWTLERISPLTPCNVAQNWTASTNPFGGTPGQQNSVYDPTPDTQGPQIVSANAPAQDTIVIVFNEGVADAAATVLSNYFIDNGIGTPVFVSTDSLTNTVTLAFAAPLSTGVDYTITILNMEDCFGNVTASQTAQLFIGGTAQPGDVIINELLPDPEPAVGLPVAEFVELYNTSSQTLDLTGWKITDGTSTAVFPAYTLPANAYVILANATNAASFTPFGAVLALPTLPSLNNAGDNIKIMLPDNTVIDEVTYSDAWYNDVVKKAGGWSLERINPVAPCGGALNWTASNNPAGGTPGQQNSVYDATPDTSGPQIVSALVYTQDTIVLTFNESLDSINAVVLSNYFIDNGIGVPVAAIVSGPLFQSVTLALSAPLSNSNTYTITVNGLVDCTGNVTDAQSVEIVLPDTAVPGDVIVNEIMFNPPSFGSDYVELYNRSDKHLDAASLKLWNEDATGQPAGGTKVSVESRVMAPGSYLLVTKDTAWVRSYYPVHNTDAFAKVTSTPSWNDDAGTVILTNANDVILDRLTYNDDWQFPLLKDKSGVSLERLSFNTPTQDSMNWHS
ncbi:MAG TPA: lamin tail domain-containing protein, partial [Chitinophagales bacterium]|nr:lamin tail domain-containing protein [Chitinophagales bacterium]